MIVMMFRLKGLIMRDWVNLKKYMNISYAPSVRCQVNMNQANQSVDLFSRLLPTEVLSRIMWMYFSLMQDIRI